MKSTWASHIEEFATPAHKKISVLVKDASQEEIERTLDAVARDAQWHYKEIKPYEGKTMLCYQTTALGQFSLSNFQIIECLLVPLENGTQIDIESRYVATRNKVALLVYFYKFGNANEFFDFFGKNRENIDCIVNSLKSAFHHVSIVDTAVDHSTHTKLSKLSLGILILKIYYLLIILCILYAVILAILLMFSVFTRFVF